MLFPAAIVVKVDSLMSKVTVEPASAVPVMVGVVSLVVRASTVGAMGRVVSTSISRDVASDVRLPAASMDVTTTSCVPSSSGSNGSLPAVICPVSSVFTL